MTGEPPIPQDTLTPPPADSPSAASPDNLAPPTTGPDIFDRSISFKEMGLRDSVLKGVQELGFEHPTKIQAMLIPRLLTGKDMLGQARTGTGKTGAFGLPLLHMASKDIPFQALILVPTRELCVQVAQEIEDLGQFTPIYPVAVYGGERMQKQIDALKKGPQIIVSTPGRLMDMIERGYLHLRNVRFAVLDEVDRMLDIGFRDDIRKILGQCPKDRQTVFVSATISPEIDRLARQYCRPDAEKVIAIVGGATTTATVKQYHLSVSQWDKRKLLAHLLTHEEPAMTLVFCRMKSTVDKLCDYLKGKGIEAHALHGDKTQSSRNSIIKKLHKGELKVLIASDLVARGIDAENITHVINYDMPEDAEVYVHRVGRTARIGREGVAYSFVTPADGELLTNVEVLINTEIPKLDYPDFVPSEPPPQYQQAPAAPPKEVVNRIAATMAPPPPVAAGAAPDAAKFPGGVVPTQLPPKRMFGKVKSSRR